MRIAEIVAASAFRRFAAAVARRHLADDILLLSDPNIPDVAFPYESAPLAEASERMLTPVGAIGAWVLSCLLDLGSRILLLAARSVVRRRARRAARERPAARARDGPG